MRKDLECVDVFLGPVRVRNGNGYEYPKVPETAALGILYSSPNKMAKFAFTSDLLSLLEEQNSCDVTIVASNGKIQAHKAILPGSCSENIITCFYPSIYLFSIARSSVFRRMLDTEMLEQADRSEHIKNLSTMAKIEFPCASRCDLFV